MTESQGQYNLSVIDGVNISNVEQTMQKIANFQRVVKKQLKQNHDFGIIPGTPKPTLLKPGAEKIIMLLGLRSTFDIVSSTRDFDKGFFQYQVKASLHKGDMLITEGLGAANNRETKYVKLDAYTLDNTLLKMAKKRALVDAALLVGSLSDIFTQDVEDMDLQEEKVSVVQQNKKAEKQDQKVEDDSSSARKALFAKANELFFSPEDIKGFVFEQYGVTSTKELNKQQIVAMIRFLEEKANERKVVNTSVKEE